MPRPRHVDSSQAKLSKLSFYGPASKRPAPTTTTPPPPRNTNLVVILPDRPPSYQPGTSAPPSQPISLLPSRHNAAGVDEGAYILDKVVTPLDGSWGPVPATADDYDTDEEDARYAANPARQKVTRQLCYVVGWPDEPYARQLVRCTDILDYVSPRVVEAWEYERMEERRAKMEATAKREDLPLKKGPGRPGRPKTAAATAAATAARVAKAAAKAAAREREAAAREAGSLLPSVPTISTTPTKQKLPSLVDGRTPRPGPSLSGLQIQLDSPSVASQVSVSLGAHPPPSLAALPTMLSSPISEKQYASPSLKRPFQKFVKESEGVDLVMTATTNTTTITSANEDDEDDDENDDDLHGDLFHSLLPANPPLRKQPSAHHRRQSQPGPPTKAAAPPPRPPRPEKAKSADRVVERPATYIAPPAVPAYKPPPPPPPGASQNYVPPNMASTAFSPSQNTPLKRKRSPVETPIVPPVFPSSQRLQSPPPPPPSHLELQMEEADDLYEVDRLEDDCLAPVDDGNSDDMEGLPADAGPETVAAPGSRLVRFFLVRWKGDWPPDQNPTWEPAENLPPRMVRQYLKKATQKLAGERDK
ncbi:hypothetical protein SBRCBS47491_000877 [Sporothrix bragantina]|uniref:Chromo domain-containing protein n=1 Tax=Sporothrix bragantina TaxID=671064 RepID=A0ABP0AU00_9PEZI